MFKPATKKPHRLEVHGDIRNDDYFWMRERDSEPVLEYLRQENERTALALHPVERLEQNLYKEMRARVKEDDSSVPAFDHGFWYYTRYETGQEYPLHCRKKGTLEAPEQVILNENALAKGQSYFEVNEVQISPDQKLLAYAVDRVGRRIYDIVFVDLETGKTLPDKIASVTANFVWAADNKTIFYVQQDLETLRAYQVFRFVLGQGKPELVYEEKDTTYNVGLGSSKSNEWLFLASEKRDSAEWRVLNAHQPLGAWHVVAPRENNMEYSLTDGGDRLYVLTNWQARNFRLMETPYAAKDKKEWREVVPVNPEVYLEGVDVYRDFILLSQREHGLTELRVLGRTTQAESRILKFPDPAYEVSAMSLPMFDSTVLRFKYESLVQPPSIYEENYASGERTLKKVREVPGYVAANYESKRIWATAADGTKVPMSIVMKKGLVLNGQNPTLLYGYGSYGLTTDIYFRSHVMSLLDRGFVFALAHIRGGSEMGREWYEQGRLMHKMNTFTDFIACAEKLIADKYTSPEHLHMMGGSAGGLLMGAVMNLRPDLFKGVIAAVPFVDVLTTMLDESIPLTTGEYKEWGDPRQKEAYFYMKTYSPYDNVTKKAYPNVLVTTGYHDSQVQYWEPAKWVAKLRELKTDDHQLLLYTEMQAGHSGASGRFEPLKTLAKEYAFLFLLEGIKD